MADVMSFFKNLFKPTPAPQPSAPVAAEPAPAPAPDALTLLIAAESTGADYVFTPSTDAIAAATHLTASALTAEAGQLTILLSSGATGANSGGKTDGFSIQLPDEFEAAASTHTVRVSAIARADRSTTAEFAISYSTNEVGNSGWRRFNATSEWTIYEFEYHVPKMKNGLSDFIGILPAPAGSPGVEIALVSARVS